MTLKSLLAAAAIFAIVYLVPVSGGPAIYAAAAVLGVMLMLGAMFVRTLRRHDDLNEWMALELNKVRRMYHLGKNLGEEDHLRAWFTELHGYLYGYLMAFEGKDFSQYQETNADFRKLSYHVYQIPDLKSDKERALYNELLDAAGTVAGARQRIKQLWDGGLPRSAWTMAILMGLAAWGGVLLSIGTVDRPVAALLLLVMEFGAMLVWDMDRMKTVRGDALATKYVENIARLELSRNRDRKAEAEEDKEEGLGNPS